jgi:hypothetical protein
MHGCSSQETGSLSALHTSLPDWQSSSFSNQFAELAGRMRESLKHSGLHRIWNILGKIPQIWLAQNESRGFPQANATALSLPLHTPEEPSSNSGQDGLPCFISVLRGFSPSLLNCGKASVHWLPLDCTLHFLSSWNSFLYQRDSFTSSWFRFVHFRKWILQHKYH